MSKVGPAMGEVPKPKAKRKFQLTKAMLPEGACARAPRGGSPSTRSQGSYF